MDFLLFTLSLGSILMISPYLSEGTTVNIEIPLYSAVNANMKVNCRIMVTGTPLIFMNLLQGSNKYQAKYVIGENIYTMVPVAGVTLETHLDDNLKTGYFTFVFSRLSCSHFTWYQCLGDEGSTSDNKTLQVKPTIERISRTSIPQPYFNEISTFTCRGSVSKEGPYSVQWYRGSISGRNGLSTNEARLSGQDQCSRTVVSTLKYNLTQSDVPNLILWCRIVGGQTIDKMENFTIQETSTLAGTLDPQPVKAGLDPGSIVGIVLGITATIVLVVLLVWFLVIRPKRLKAEGAAKDQGPEPNAKDYQVQDNILYATVDPLKKQNHKSSLSSLADGPDTNSNSVQDTGTAAKKMKSNKKNAFLPSHGDATDNIDEAYELPPPPPMPKPHQSPQIESDNPLHYAELELAVHKSAKRRSKYGTRPNTDYAVITHS